MTVKVRVSRRPIRALCFDLENRPLAYWYDGQTTSEITAFGWKWSDERQVHSLVLRADGRYEDGDGKRVGYRKAHEQFGDLLASADLCYGHNIRRHDLPLVSAWRMRLQLDPLGPLRTTDTCRDIPKRKDLSASLENLAAMYGLKLPKHRMTQPAWELANQLRPAGVDAARVRVETDVLLQEALRAKLIEVGLLGPPRMWSA
jgi:hypothetical protein